MHLKERKKQAFTTDCSPPRWGSHCPQEGARESVSIPTTVWQELGNWQSLSEASWQLYWSSSISCFKPRNPPLTSTVRIKEYITWLGEKKKGQYAINNSPWFISKKFLLLFYLWLCVLDVCVHAGAHVCVFVKVGHQPWMPSSSLFILFFWDGAAYCSLIHRGWWLVGISSTCLLSPSLLSFLHGYTLGSLQ